MMKYKLPLLATSFFIFVSAAAQTILVQPYLQDANPDNLRIMWETSSGDESTVEWGLTNILGNTAAGTVQTGSGTSRIHDTQLTGLTPDTRYYYRVKTGAAVSAIYDFITPPLKNAEKSFQIVLMSDMQQDASNPTKFYEVCNDGVIDYIQDIGTGDIPTDIACLMLPGDLVDNGNVYDQWKNTFFNPAENLLRYTPVYPVLGNHENNNASYFKYFHLPGNGTAGYEEHWWYKDYSNVRIIGLDSNPAYTLPVQLSWLQTVLNDACSDPDIDFVFAQLHHPYHSELWIAGNSDYTGDVIEMLESFSTQCGKPSVHFYGHTHAYSRGHSRDHNHVMVNVATAGGNIDYWDEYAQVDYPEHVISQDDYGFVWAEVQAGANPQFVLRRISRGNEQVPRDNELRDSIRIRRYNTAPGQPSGVFPLQDEVINPDCNTMFTASPYSDADGDLHGATHWQIATDAAFSNIVLDQWRQYKNEYHNNDTQANDNLINEPVSNLQPATAYYWRVRYRDRSLAWSDWSQVIGFETSTSAVTANLLSNGGAEDNTNSWVEVAGSFESITSGQCAGNNAHTGARLFAVGGVCEDNPYGEGYQEVNMAPFASSIAQGIAVARFGGYLSDYQGTDFPQFRLDFMTSGGSLISSTPLYGAHSNAWVALDQTAPVPTDCGRIRMVLTGTREAGSDNDSYFDDMYLRLDTLNCGTVYPPCAQNPVIISSAPSGSSCINDIVTYTCSPNLAGAIYHWEITGDGVLLSGQGTHQITIQWTGGLAGSVKVYQTIE